MTHETIADLRALLAKATPGPWMYLPENMPGGRAIVPMDGPAVVPNAWDMTEADAAYIAALSPDVVLALLAAVSPVAVDQPTGFLPGMKVGTGGNDLTPAPASLDAAQLADELLATGATFPVPVRGSNRDALIAFLAARLTIPGGQS